MPRSKWIIWNCDKSGRSFRVLRSCKICCSFHVDGAVDPSLAHCSLSGEIRNFLLTKYSSVDAPK
jgi:hypothetical protein